VEYVPNRPLQSNDHERVPQGQQRPGDVVSKRLQADLMHGSIEVVPDARFPGQQE